MNNLPPRYAQSISLPAGCTAWQEISSQQPRAVSLSPSRQPEHPASKRINALQHLDATGVRKVSPGDCNLNARARFLQGPQRSFEPNPSMPAGNAKSFRKIERNATHRSAQLRCKVTIPPLNSFNDGPRQPNHLKCMLNNRRASWLVHALSAQVP